MPILAHKFSLRPLEQTLQITFKRLQVLEVATPDVVEAAEAEVGGGVDVEVMGVKDGWTLTDTGG